MPVSVGSAVGYLDLDIQGFLSGLQKANEEAQKKSKTLSNTLGDGLQTVGNKIAGAGKTMSVAVTTPIVGAGTAALKTAANFDSGMSKVAAVSGAAGKDLDDLRSKALEMGAKTKFSASEAADAMNYMAMAGWKTNDMLGGIEGIMNLAAASGEDLATTSDIVTDALTAFGMKAQDSGRFADILAAASSNANTNVSMLGESFKYVAPQAGALGYSAEDVSIALGLMANSGIKASQGGTALRTLLANMSDPTDEVAGAMDRLGVSLDDGNGNMLSFREIMLQLREGFGDLKISEEDLTSGLDDLAAKYESGEITEKEYNEATEALMESAYGAEGALKAQAAAQLSGKTGLSGLLAIVNSSDEDFNKLANAIDNSSYSLDDITDSLDKSGIQWEKYLDQNWNSMGDGVRGLADDIAYNLAIIGTDADELQTHLQMEYGLNADDAKAAIDSVKKSLEGTTGAAENMAKIMQDNLEGRITTLKSTMEGISITVGNILMPYAEKAVEKLKQLVDWFAGLSDEQQKTIVKIAAMVAAVGPLLFVFGNLIVGVGSLIKSFGEIKTAIAGIKAGFAMIQTSASGVLLPIAAIIAIVGVLIAAFVNLGKNNEEFREKIISIWNGIKESISNFISQISERLAAIGITFESVTGAISAIWNGFCQILAPVFIGAFELIQETLQFVFDAIVGILDVFIGIFTGNWEQAINGVKEFWSAAWEWIKNILMTLLETIKGVIGTFLSWFGLSLDEGLSAAKELFFNTFDKVKEIVGGAFKFIKEKVSDGIGNAKDTLDRVLNSIGDKFTEIWEGAKSTVSGAIEFIKGLFNFEWRLPDIPLPHFSVSGSFGWSWDGGLELPSVSVDWYKKAMNNGMILDAATIFGFNPKSGKFLGGGEAGSEVVVGTQSLLSMIKNAMGEVVEGILPAMYSKYFGNDFETVKDIQGTLFDINAFSRSLYELLKNAPIENNVNVEMQDGNVYLDNERVGRKIAPVVSRIQAQGG